jgi:hypothetical protein
MLKSFLVSSNEDEDQLEEEQEQEYETREITTNQVF